MRTLTALLCALVLPGLASANELLKVYDQALENDTQLQAAAAARDAALAGRKQALGGLLPQINAQGNYAWDDATSKNTRFCNGVLLTTPADCDTMSEPYNMSLNLSQVLFNKQVWDQWQQAGDRAAAAEASYQSARQNVALRVAEAYFNLLAAADSVRLAEAEKKAIERQLDLAQKRFEVGLSAITDVQEAQARYDLTVATAIEAEQSLSSARAAMAEITGYSYTSTSMLKDEIPLLGPDPDNLNDWVAAASNGNFTLISARIQADIARNGIDISQDGHLPTVSLNGQKSLGESAGFNPTEYESTQVSVNVTVPLFAGGATEAGVRAARSTFRQRQAELEGTRRQVERITRDAYQGVIAGVARVKARKQAVLSSTTAMEAAEVGLEVGTRTAVDVLNAQRELYSAQRDYSRARYDYLLNVLRLKNAAGLLAQKDLAEVDALLLN